MLPLMNKSLRSNLRALKNRVSKEIQESVSLIKVYVDYNNLEGIGNQQ